MQEGMDGKRLFLCGIRKIWMVLLAAVTGALFGCACYLVIHVVFAPAREYEAVSKLYIDFEEDQTGKAYQYYNAHTWDDLMTTDPILDKTMAALPDGYDRGMVEQSVTADIPTDIRLMTITIRTHSPEESAEILDATNQALVKFAEEIKELERISVFKVTEPKLVVFDLYTGRVTALVGAITGFFAFLVWLLVYALDERILLPIDVKNRYGWPVLGVLEWREEQLKANLMGKEDALFLLPQTVECQDDKDYVQRWLEQNGTQLGEKTEILEIPLEDQTAQQIKEVYDTLQKYEKLYLLVACGRKQGKVLSYIEEQLALRNRSVDGAILFHADKKLLNQYYFGKTKSDR